MSTLHLRQTATWGIVVLMALVGCSQRRITVIASGSSDSTTNQSTSVCNGPILATLAAINLPSYGARVGDPLAFEITAYGCTGNFRAYRVEAPNVIYPLNTFTRAYYTLVPSQSAANYFERVVVQSIDGSGKVLSSITIASPVLNIQSALSCSVVASATTLPVATNSSGTVMTPATFGFSVSTSSDAQLSSVESCQSVVGTSPNLPTPVGKTHQVNISVSSVGQKTFLFRVKDPVTHSESTCSASVTTTAQQVAAPVITSFTANPMMPALGAPVVLSLAATGNISSAMIGGTLVTFTNASATRTVTASTTGKTTLSASVTGPGGTAAASTYYTAHPTCTLQAQAVSKNIGQDYPLVLNISGGFTSASIAGPGLTPVNVTGSPNGVSQNILSRVLEAKGAGEAVASVIGPDGTSATCRAAINTVNAVPSLSVTVNGKSGDKIPVYVLSNVDFSWNAVNAVSCRNGDTGAPLNVAGTFSVTNIRRDVSFTLICRGLDGLDRGVSIVAQVSGRWFQANSLECNYACSTLGLINTASPDGYRCVSGEDRAVSLEQQTLEKPVYTYGCWNTCSPMNPMDTSSVGGYCFGSHQPRDYDGTDRTTGCFCDAPPVGV